MMFQSSFLIRCWMNPSEGTANVQTYHIQHVQSGLEFRSANLSAVNEWMTAENARYLVERQKRTSDSDAGEGL
jgi:hypothetical protein